MDDIANVEVTPEMVERAKLVLLRRWVELVEPRSLELFSSVAADALAEALRSPR